MGVDFDWICRGGREYGRSVVLDGEKTETAKGSSVVIPLRDMVQLANINTAMDVGYLMLEYKINLKIPEFYDKYMNLVKKQKELYFRELIEIFSHNKKEYVRDLLDKYAGFSTQDVLLLLMCEMQLDNKTMARIMGLTLETLKKRKTRMRIKMRTASPVTL